MADSKYADLPGIAHDEPDVYETTDLPESDQVGDFYYEKDSEVIERIHIEPDQAFNKFKGKYLNQRNADFSDRISNTNRTGYDAISGNWELTGDGQNESPIQKYNRLYCELNELLEDVTKIQSTKSDKGDDLVTPAQIQDALSKLKALQLEESLGSDMLSTMDDPQRFLLKKLESELEQFSKIAKEPPQGEEKTDESGIVYHINYKPELAKLKQTSRVAQLEARVHHLETVLGASNEKLNRLSAGTSKDSLLETAQHLAAVATLLDSAQLDHIEGRLTALMQKLEAIQDKTKEIDEEDERNKMVNELYDMVKSGENIIKLLPKTIERLKSLEGLHNKAAELMTTLIKVESIQGEISSSVVNNKELLQGVQESFAHNLNEINETILSLDNRIKALKAKK
ncbi:dynactin subunit 2 [Coccinella septempunctata]|uniref:dynactin subunit 2 n=1 Tax=Coccinella septempunctata TaxID=41139 RepID=UPI001D091B4D|nr:dynactin subunit 2 [Coccinella septempunctata]